MLNHQRVSGIYADILWQGIWSSRLRSSRASFEIWSSLLGGEGKKERLWQNYCHKHPKCPQTGSNWKVGRKFNSWIEPQLWLECMSWPLPQGIPALSHLIMIFNIITIKKYPFIDRVITPVHVLLVDHHGFNSIHVWWMCSSWSATITCVKARSRGKLGGKAIGKCGWTMPLQYCAICLVEINDSHWISNCEFQNALVDCKFNACCLHRAVLEGSK